MESNKAQQSFWSASKTVSLATAIGAVATALNSLILAHVLGPSGVGLVSLLISIPLIAVVLSNWGFHSAGIYYLGQQKYSNTEILSSVAWVGIGIGSGLILLGTAGLPLLAQFLQSASPLAIFLAVLTSLPQTLLLYMGDMSIGLHQIKLAALLRVLPGSLYCCLCLLFVLLLRLGVTGAILAYLTGISSTVGIALIRLHRAGYIKLRMNKEFVREAAVFGLKSHIGDVAQYLVYRLDLLFVNYFAGLQATGYYSIAVRMAELLWIPSDALRVILLAQVSSQNGKSTSSLTAFLSRSLLFFGSIVAAGLAILGNLFISLFLPGYLPSILLFWLLLPGIVANSAFRVIIGDTTGRGSPGTVAKIATSGFVVGLLLYALFIPRFGPAGAAMASSVLYIGEYIAATIANARLVQLHPAVFVLVRREDIHYTVTSFSKALHERLTAARLI
jgi:O-antigen/teichoic acid export membrane protein